MEQTKNEMPHWLLKRASLTPDRLALVAEDETWTFRELNERAQQTAKHFMQMGLQAGDHVALLAHNGSHTVTLIHALSYVGAVLIPLNIRLTTDELTWQVEDAAASWLIGDEAHAGKARTIAKKRPGTQVVIWPDTLSLQPDETRFALNSTISLADRQAIMYTSGTTGKPKGVMLSYGNHWWSAAGSALNLGLHIDDRWLISVPLFHMSGLSILMRSVIYGITAVIHETFDPEEANRAITEDGVTIVSVVSDMLRRMVECLGDARYPETLRCVLLGGGPVPMPILEQCQQKGIPVFQTYGLTETASQIATLSPEYMLTKAGSAGKPLFPAELRIVAEDGTICEAEKEGEIVVKGPSVTSGYWQREQATKEAIRDGWLYTGDIGYVDADGFLYVLDRRSDLLISGGENVYPAEIESVLISHPAVAEAGVTGIRDRRWGQVPVAFVVLHAGKDVTEQDLITFCRKRLARYKVPVHVQFVDALPRNSANKLLRRKLLNLLENEDKCDNMVNNTNLSEGAK